MLWALIAMAGFADAEAQGTPPSDGQPKVYVFAVTNVRPHVLQKMLETAMPGVGVTVYGRVGDFSRALEASPPDAALAAAPVLSAFGQRPDVQGTKGGSAEEEYLLLSETALAPDKLDALTIGCLDLVGRKGLPAFVASVLGISREPEIQRVTKTEDLLQLLQFKRADAVLIPEGSLGDLKTRTKMDFKILRLPSAKVLRTAIAFPGNRQRVEGALRALPLAITAHLGVDRWQ